jgi:hypothetical protein
MGADLRGARMGKTAWPKDIVWNNLDTTLLGSTVFAGTNTVGVVGLQECEYYRGDCAVDFSTIEMSWPLPSSFLRRCGISPVMIDYLPSLLTNALQFYSCFISYSHDDADNEITSALDKERKIMKGGRKRTVLIPLNLDGYLFSDEWLSGKSQIVRSRFAADFTNWGNDSSRFEEQLERLLLALSNLRREEGAAA